VKPLLRIVVASVIADNRLLRLTRNVGLGRRYELQRYNSLAIERSTRGRVLTKYPSGRKVVTNCDRFDGCDKAASPELGDGLGAVDRGDGRRLDGTPAPCDQRGVARRLLRCKRITSGGERGGHTR